MPKQLGITRAVIDYLSEHQGEELAVQDIEAAVLPRLQGIAGRPLAYKTVCNIVAKICTDFPCCFRVRHGVYVWDENEENWNKYSYTSNTDRLVKLLEAADKPLSYDVLMRELNVNYNALLMLLTNAQSTNGVELKRYQVVELVSDKRKANKELV